LTGLDSGGACTRGGGGMNVVDPIPTSWKKTNPWHIEKPKSGGGGKVVQKKGISKKKWGR